MRKLLPFIFSCLIFNQIQGQFVDCYQESNWNIVENNTGPNTLEPGVTFNGTTSMTLIADGDFLGVSGNGAPAGIPFNCMVNDGIVMACTSIAGDGLVTFDWDYSMELYFENPANEPFGYCINSDDFVSLMAPNTWSDQSGSESIDVESGDSFCLVQASYFSEEFQAVTIVDNFSAPCPQQIEGLEDCWEEENWTVTATNSTGSAVFGSNSITINSDTDFSGTGMDILLCSAPNGMETVCIEVPSSGEMTFDWDVDYPPLSNPLLDRFGYCINGFVTELTSLGTTNGTETVSIDAGDDFCFVFASKFADSGLVTATINNFLLPDCPPGAITLELITSIDGDECDGGNGAIEVEVIGGVGDLTYEWDSELASGANPTNLPGGTYCVTVSDEDGNEETACAEIILPEPLVLNMSSIPQSDMSTGTASVSVSGGTPPYEYLWDDDDAQTTISAYDVGTGTFTVVVTDANGCEATGSVFVDLIESVGELLEGVNFEVYPNPSRGEITVQIESIIEGDFTLILYDVSGRLLWSRTIKNIQGIQETYDLKEFGQGLYLLQVGNSSGLISKAIQIHD